MFVLQTTSSVKDTVLLVQLILISILNPVNVSVVLVSLPINSVFVPKNAVLMKNITHLPINVPVSRVLEESMEPVLSALLDHLPQLTAQPVTVAALTNNLKAENAFVSKDLPTIQQESVLSVPTSPMVS